MQLHRVQSFLHKHVNKTLSNFEYLEEHQSTTKDFSPLLQPHDTGDGIAWLKDKIEPQIHPATKADRRICLFKASLDGGNFLMLLSHDFENKLCLNLLIFSHLSEVHLSYAQQTNFSSSIKSIFSTHLGDQLSFLNVWVIKGCFSHIFHQLIFEILKNLM